MTFVSDDVVLVKFKNGRCVTFTSNGLIRRMEYTKSADESQEDYEDMKKKIQDCIDVMSLPECELVQ